MLTVLSLWLPILVSAVLVFLASSVIHMFLGYHASDFARVPDEDGTGAALRVVPAGDYVIPHAKNMAALGSPEFIERRTKGPVVVMTVMEPGPPTMTTELILWFLYTLVVSVFAAYLTGRAVPAGGQFSEVVRFASTTAFVAYALGGWQESIWLKRKWSTTIKNTVDGLIYGLITGLTFGWLWPA